VVCIFQIWFYSYNGEGDDACNLPLKISDIFPLGLQIFIYRRKKSLRCVIVVFVEFIFWRDKVIRVLIQREICQVHKQVLNVNMVGLSIVRSAKPGESFITKVCLQWVDAFNDYIEPKIKLFLINKIRVLNVSLNKEVMSEGRPR
jgi:hypothetical protein